MKKIDPERDSRHEDGIAWRSNIADLAHDDYLRQREAAMEFDDPEKGKVLLPGVFPRMLKSAGRVKYLVAKLGEHNHEVYGDFLGLPSDEISNLQDKRVI